MLESCSIRIVLLTLVCCVFGVSSFDQKCDHRNPFPSEDRELRRNRDDLIEVAKAYLQSKLTGKIAKGLYYSDDVRGVIEILTAVNKGDATWTLEVKSSMLECLVTLQAPKGFAIRYENSTCYRNFYQLSIDCLKWRSGFQLRTDTDVQVKKIKGNPDVLEVTVKDGNLRTCAVTAYRYTDYTLSSVQTMCRLNEPSDIAYNGYNMDLNEATHHVENLVLFMKTECKDPEEVYVPSITPDELKKALLKYMKEHHSSPYPDLSTATHLTIDAPDGRRQRNITWTWNEKRKCVGLIREVPQRFAIMGILLRIEGSKCIYESEEDLAEDMTLNALRALFDILPVTSYARIHYPYSKERFVVRYRDQYADHRRGFDCYFFMKHRLFDRYKGDLRIVKWICA